MPEPAMAAGAETRADGTTVLVVDDESMMLTMLARELPRLGFGVVTAGSGAEALTVAASRDIAVAIVDMLMPGLDGIETLGRLRSESPRTEVVLLTGHGTIEGAVAAMRAGAYDYLTKPVKLAELSAVLHRAVEHRKLLRENEALRLLVSGRGETGFVIAASPGMKAVMERVERVASSDSPVLIQGESGTGKELVARALHQLSTRRKGPFVDLNCSAVQDTLLESELFGHQRGAFTGAVERRLGLMEAADGGTIFLDEVAEMSAPVQAKVLRALESGEIRRVGESRTTRVDVRVLAATNKNLASLVASGGFRDDLFYRLNTVMIEVPPLRERRADIEPLALHFLAIPTGPGRTGLVLSDEALVVMQAHRWPGNVRELKNCIEAMRILSRGTELGVEDLPGSVRAEVVPRGAHRESVSARIRPLDEVIGETVRQAVEASGGNKSQAARALGIDLKTLSKRLRPDGD